MKRVRQAAQGADPNALSIHLGLSDLDRFRRGLLPADEASQVAAHLAHCPDCNDLLLLLFAVSAPEAPATAEPSSAESADLWRRIGRELVDPADALDAEIDAAYATLAELADAPETTKKKTDLGRAFARLRALQEQEAERHRRQFEARLLMPIDAGAQILERSRALKERLEDLATAHAATAGTASA